MEQILLGDTQLFQNRSMKYCIIDVIRSLFDSDFYQSSRMNSRAESLKRSSFIPKARQPSPASKFRYFGDDSQISELANIHFKKSGDLLGARFTDSSSFKFTNISRIDNCDKENRQLKPQMQAKYGREDQGKEWENQKHDLMKSEVSQISNGQSESHHNLKGEIGVLTGRLKNLEGLLQTLAENEIKTRQQIRSLRKCVSEKSLGKSDSVRFKPSASNYNFNFDSDFDSHPAITDLITHSLHNRIKRDIRRKESDSGCQCGEKEKEKEQLSGIIFELYEENKFYERQISKMGELKKSSVMKNKARINELLTKIRNI